ncbi:hypothetical protein B0H15DRAFT_794362 [Mycena belliarum]|uniref:Uncharacterized protein n=1 Tax=Mycena belliarum TaxID=1033014 RepID=A0AAD6XHM3_9AGAR|nr:hypothetical protein B0H15DRAFT_794362 [Mycena belliae]
MPSPPAGLDIVSLTGASGSQLDFWIDAVNKNAGKKILTKTGKVDIRRDRLAGYYGLDLSVIPAAPTIGPIPHDVDINKRQWAHLRLLGAEWAEKDSANIPFRLVKDEITESVNAPHCNYIGFAHSHSCPYIIKSAIQETLANAGGVSARTLSDNEQNPGNIDDETVQALIQSARDGDISAIVKLFKVQASISGKELFSPAAPNVLSSDSNSNPSTSSSTSLSITAQTPLSPSTLAVQSADSAPDSRILASGGMEIEALSRAEGLRDVIEQCENGAVAKIRELYGPQTGREANPMWANIKMTITRRERVALELKNEFRGDKEKFFAFFTVPDSGSKKRKVTEPTEKLRPLRRIVEAISRRNKDLTTEQQLEVYQNNGVFSAELWEMKWSGNNKWEIWRAIGMERY